MIEKIRNLPQESGIYQYFDQDSRILYIGKAKNLKKRVKSYFSFEGGNLAPAANLSPRIAHMVQKIRDIKIIVVNREEEALILENSLIKQLKPRYNVLLRDDKTYPYILIDKSRDFPRPEVVRKIVRDKNHAYFGPYASGVKELLDTIYEALPLVQKKSCLSAKAPCLFYQIKRCKAPCAGKIDKIQYSEILEEAIFLLKNPQKLLGILEARMAFLAKNLRFEEANLIKLRLQKLGYIANLGIIDLAKLYDFDIFAIASEGGKSVVLKLFMRGGKVVFSDHYTLSHNDLDPSPDYLYTQALINHYRHNEILRLDAILLPIALENQAPIAEFLRSKSSKIVRILAPQSGEKRQLVELALKNAKKILEDSQSAQNALITARVRSLLGLDSAPNRIEIFDTSHHGGRDCVGAMVVFENGEFVKGAYRRYGLLGSDEYAQMQEMLTRRAKDFERDSPPDLWLIDGGAAQINIALSVLGSCGASVEVAAIAKEKINHRAYRAKGAARDILRTKSLELRLEAHDERLLFFQKLRDEAHRFAISFHRKRKLKNLKTLPYSSAQTKKLLDFFGSFEALQNADEAEIKAVLSRKNCKNLPSTSPVNLKKD